MARGRRYTHTLPVVPLSVRLILTGGMLLAATLALLAYASDAPESRWDRIQRTGVVRLGYAPEAPFAYTDSTGRVTGLDPERARVLFARLGVDSVEWVQTEFRSLIPELVAGRFDMIAMSLVATPERTRDIAFSRPTFRVVPGLLVRSEDARRYATLAGLRAAPRRIAVVDGAFEIPLLLAHGFPASRLLHLPDALTGVASVRSGEAAALALTAPTVRHLAAGSDGALVAVSLEVSSGSVAPAGYGAFGFPRGERAFRRAVDDALERIIGSPEERALAARSGFSPADLP